MEGQRISHEAFRYSTLMDRISQRSADIMAQDPRVARRTEDLMHLATYQYDENDLRIIRAAVDIAVTAHHGKFRKKDLDIDGYPLPYVMHPFEVAELLMYQRLPQDQNPEDEIPPAEYVAAALLHDVAEEAELQHNIPGANADDSWADHLEKLVLHGAQAHKDQMSRLNESLRLLGKPEREVLNTSLNRNLTNHVGSLLEMLFHDIVQVHKFGQHNVEMSATVMNFIDEQSSPYNFIASKQNRWSIAIKGIDGITNLVPDQVTFPKLLRTSFIARFCKQIGAIDVHDRLLEVLETCINEGPASTTITEPFLKGIQSGENFWDIIRVTLSEYSASSRRFQKIIRDRSAKKN